MGRTYDSYNGVINYMLIHVRQDGMIDIWIVLDDICEHHTYQTWQTAFKKHPIMFGASYLKIFVQGY